MEQELFHHSSIPKAYFSLSLPVVLSMVVTIIYNMADTFFIAQTQNTDLVAGVSISAPVFTILMAFGNIWGQGGCSLISRLLGQKDADTIRRTSSFCFYMALLSGVISGACMLLFQNDFLQLLGANKDSLLYSQQYYVCMALGAPFIVASFVHSNLLRSLGLSKESMIGSVGGAVINIIFDPILIFICGLGAMGAAIATVGGYIFSVLHFILIVYKKCPQFSLSPKECVIPSAQQIQIIGVGVPASLVNLMQSLSIILVNQALLPYGNDKIAAMGIVLKVNSIAILLLVGFTFGGQPLIGYFYGANNKEKLSQLLRFVVKFICGLSFILTAILFVSAPFILPMFLSDAGIISDGIIMLRLQVISLILVGIIQIIMIIFQSTGKILAGLLLSISRQGVIFVIVLLIASSIFGYYGIISAQAIADMITAGFAVILYFKTVYPELSGYNSDK